MARDADGTPLNVGDIVEFKADIEQSGKITKIVGRTLWIESLSDEGFSGSYIGGEKTFTEASDRVWKEE